MSNTKKRAAPSQEGGEGQKAKKQKKKSAYQVDETLLNAELGINESFAVMDNQLLADYTAQKISRFGTDLSPVELSDLSISGEFSTSPVIISTITTLLMYIMLFERAARIMKRGRNRKIEL